MSAETSTLTTVSRVTTADVEMQPALISPVARDERIESIDVLRGVAVLGILLMNIAAFGLPMNAYINPSAAGGHTGLNLVYWFINQVLFEGKMRALFSMLFGAGAVLLTKRAEERGGGLRVADIYYRRTLWLILFGLLHAYFIWWGDILYFYGVAGLMLFPLRRARPQGFARRWVRAAADRHGQVLLEYLRRPEASQQSSSGRPRVGARQAGAGRAEGDEEKMGREA